MATYEEVKVVNVKAGQHYKHFKGAIYKVFCIAIHTETEEIEVIYSNIKNPKKFYARPLEMFTSDVDAQKYPDHAGEKRFTLLEKGKVKKLKKSNKKHK